MRFDFDTITIFFVCFLIGALGVILFVPNPKTQEINGHDFIDAGNFTVQWVHDPDCRRCKK